MKRDLLILMLAVLLRIVFPASAQDSCEPDRFFPDAGNCGYDVKDYQLDMAWTLEGDTWDVRETVTFVSEWDTDELRFDFSDVYQIAELTIDGSPAEYSREETKLAVRYDFTHDTEYKLYAAFSGKLRWGDIFDPDGSARHEEDGFCMINEPTNAWRFYICNDHPKDKASYHYSFTVPAGYVPAGSGRLLKIEEADETVIIPGRRYERRWDPDAGPEDGTVTFTYAQEAQTAPYLFTVCAGAFDMKLRTTEDGKVRLDFVDRGHPDTETAWALTDMQEEIISVLSEYFGEYPYDDLGAIVAKTSLSAALETQGRPIYDAGTTSETVFAHEITHQWMGDLVSLEDWSDLWIKEGAATFGEALWKLHKGGEEAYTADITQKYEVIVNGRHSFMPAADDSLERLRAAWGIPDDSTLYDHEKAVKAAAAVCGIRTDQVRLKEGDVTFAEWAEGIKASCETLRTGPRVDPYLSEMTGRAIRTARPDHYAGPKDIEGKDAISLYGAEAYMGGSVVYHALRCKLGDEIFIRGLRTLIEENKWGTVNEEKFISAFSRVSGEDLTGFIRSYLYYGENGHIPDLPCIETWEEARAKYEVR